MTNPCHPPDPNWRAPKTQLPAGTCDTHVHIMGPFDKFSILKNLKNKYIENFNDDKSISKTINSLTNLNFNEINDCRLQSNKLINDYASIRLMKNHLDQIF